MITEPTQVTFCNESLRTLADKMIQDYKNKKVVLARFNAINTVYPFPNDENEVIDDGADKDKRLPINSKQVLAFMARAKAEMEAYEANDNEVLNQLMAIAVNY